MHKNMVKKQKRFNPCIKVKKEIKTKEEFDDLKPFEHGEEGTHSCCSKRLSKEGGKARCCYCVPHEGCEIGV